MKEPQVIRVPRFTELTGSHVTDHGSANLKMGLDKMPNTKFSSIQISSRSVVGTKLAKV